jgi:hypothetical protein
MSTINKRVGKGFDPNRWITVNHLPLNVRPVDILCYLMDNMELSHKDSMSAIESMANGVSVGVRLSEGLDGRTISNELKDMGFDVLYWRDRYYRD